MEVVTSDNVGLIAQVSITGRLGNDPSLVLYLRYVHLVLGELVSYSSLRTRVILADQVDLSEVILVLFDTLLPVLLEHVVVVLQFGILSLR